MLPHLARSLSCHLFDFNIELIKVLGLVCDVIVMSCSVFFITKTCLFKYIENLTAKEMKKSDKSSNIFHISADEVLTCTHNLCF